MYTPMSHVEKCSDRNYYKRLKMKTIQMAINDNVVKSIGNSSYNGKLYIAIKLTNCNQTVLNVYISQT